ncbi:hypothetical protein LP52_16020 [Streptomonospora alba]|uniref:Uncharacterized protein n=1 Tax=Streptomonospora alba TaxID=183763 RepID=A0A0C2FFK7_9ACTN|nr:hypothetical protein [Streptomonospora alba]KIH98019.1 hypothetical protein LP52_16020 [Streptomonospora alba]
MQRHNRIFLASGLVVIVGLTVNQYFGIWTVLAVLAVYGAGVFVWVRNVKRKDRNHDAAPSHGDP